MAKSIRCLEVNMQTKELLRFLKYEKVEYKPLGEVCEFRRGSFPQPYTNQSYYGGLEAMPFVQVADIGNNFLLKPITKQSISKIAQPLSVFVPKDTIIVSLQGTIGRVAITQYDSYVDRTIAIFNNISNLFNKKFFAYVLYMIFDKKKRKARGGIIKTITKEEFKNFPIPLPPLEVQNAIVAILDKFTELEKE
ncbi:restriction endonuclease subunit S, partial [Helicobacter turcicus]